MLDLLQREIALKVGSLDALREKFPLLVRDAVDFVLDAVTTARTSLRDLDNVEKTFIGLKLEHFVRDMLDVPKGLRDLELAGLDVDVKNTVGSNWSIPQETYRASEPCLLMAINDDRCVCSLGLIIAKPEYLHAGGNRDSKRGVSTHGFEHILWLVADTPFPPSKFTGLDMSRFRELRKVKGGNKRACQFFRDNLFRVVHRDVIISLLFDQNDPMKRLRAGKGAPDILRHESIAILIGTYRADRVLAGALSIPDLAQTDIVAVQPRTIEERLLLVSEGLIES